MLSAIWGMAFVAIRQVEFELSPVNLALSRWLIASAIFLVLLPIIGRPKVRLERKALPRLLFVALTNVAGYHLFLNYSEATISAGLAGLLISLGPVFMVVLSAFLLSEKAGRRVIVALSLAVAGTVVLSIGSVNLSELSSFVGPVEAVLAALCYAAFTVLGKPLVQKYGSAPTTILAGLVGTSMILPLLSWGFLAQMGALDRNGWASVLYLGVLSNVLGYLLYYTLVSRGSVSRFSVQLFLIPIVSVVGGALLLGESVTAFTVVGGAMMLVAVGLATAK